MADLFENVVDAAMAVFNEDPAGAVYRRMTPTGLDPPIQIESLILGSPSEISQIFSQDIIRNQEFIHVRKSEISVEPTKGSTFVFNSATYTVVNTPEEDSQDLTWHCECKKE